MATYAYRQNIYTASATVGGYIEYNVSVPFRAALGVGDTVRITGKVRCNDFAIKSLEVIFFTPNIRAEIGCFINKSIAKSTAGAFTINLAVTQEVIDALWRYITASQQTNECYPVFCVYSAINCEGTGYDTVMNDNYYYTFIKARVSPVLSSVSLSDLTGATSGGQTLLQYFGGYVQGASLPRLTAAFTTDSRDAKLTATHTLVVRDGNDAIVAQVSGESAAQATSMALDLPAIATPGTYGWTWSVTDSAGMAATDSTGTLTVLAYAAPAITEYDVERYVTVVGEPDPVPSPSGVYVMLTIKGSVAQVAAKNAWTMVLRWGTAGGATADVTIASGSDGATLKYERDDTLFTTQITLADAYEFSVILTDMVHQIVVTDDVMKASCYLNVEKHGIGIGMHTHATQADKRVEISDDYRLMPYGDVIIPEDKLLKVVTVSDTVTVSTDSASQSKTIAVNPGTGWTAISVVGFEASQSWCAVRQARLVNGSVEMAVRYHGSSSTGQTVTLTAAVLCLHTTLN